MCIKTGIKSLRVYFLLLVLFLLYLVFCPECKAWSTGPNNSADIGQLSPGASIEEYVVYSEGVQDYVDVPFPSDHKINGANIMLIYENHTSVIQPDGTYYQRVIVTEIPSADTGYRWDQPTLSYDDFYALGYKSVDPNRLLMFYDLNDGQITSSYLSGSGGHRYPFCSIWFPYYDNNGNFLGYYTNGSVSNILTGSGNPVLTSFINLYNLVRENDTWVIGSVNKVGVEYPSYVTEVNKISWLALDNSLQGIAKGDLHSFSFMIENYNADEIGNVFINFIEPNNSIENASYLHKYNLYGVPIFINHHFLPGQYGQIVVDNQYTAIVTINMQYFTHFNNYAGTGFFPVSRRNLLLFFDKYSTSYTGRKNIISVLVYE